MKRSLQILLGLLFPVISNCASGQESFSLTDSVFHVYSEHKMALMLNNFSNRFSGGDDIFYLENKGEIDSLVQFIDTHPQLILEIGVCTDYRGSEDFNQQISEDQAKNFILYLKNHGASTFHLLSKGYGETRLIHPPEAIEKMATEEEKEFAHGQNGRIVVKILAI